MELYLMLNGTQVGPYKIEDVQGWIKAGYVKMDDPAWYDGCKDWITVKEIPKINEVTSGHNVGGHLVPPFEAYAGDEPYIFISYAHTRIVPRYLRRSVSSMMQAIISGMMKGLRPAVNGPRKLPMQ